MCAFKNIAAVALVFLSGAGLLTAAESFDRGEVSMVVNRVDILQSQRSSRPARVQDVLSAGMALQTGDRSRSEVIFPDGTLTRLGSNSLFRFEAGTRTIDLDRGTLLFDGDRKKGGGTVRTAAVTAAVTGTSFLFEYLPGKLVKLIVLNGRVRLALTSNPRVRRDLVAGQMVEMRPTDSSIPRPVTIDLKRLVETSLLLEGGRLPGMEKIRRAIAYQQSQFQRGRLQAPFSATQQAQTAQTSRNAVPPVPPPPRPQVTPVIPPPPPPTPPPTPIPQPTSAPTYYTPPPP